MTTDATPVVVNFALEPPAASESEIPDRVISELRNARTVAKDYAQAYSDAGEAQAQKFGVKASALKRYVAALEDDRLQEVGEEILDLERLIG